MTGARQALRLLWRRHVLAPSRRRRYRAMPVAMVTGSAGKTTTARLLAAILAADGHTVGLACTDGAWVGDDLLMAHDLAGYGGHRRVLADPRTTAAVLETARLGILTQGFYVDRCNVAALTNVGPHHLGFDGIDTLDQMTELKARVLDRATGAVVLNADDARVAALARRFDPARVIAFSLAPDSPAVAAAVTAGGRSVTADADGLIRLDGVPLVAVAEVPVTLGGAAPHFTANAMAAAGLAAGLGIARDTIRAGLIGFEGGMAHNPTRLSLIGGYPFTVLLDRGFNPSAVTATVATLRRMPVAGRRLCLLSGIGNRLDRIYEQVAGIAAAEFDHFVCYDLVEYRRQRAPGEVPGLIAGFLAARGVAPEAIDIAASLDEGLTRIAARARPGDGLMLLAAASDLEARIRRAFAGE